MQGKKVSLKILLMIVALMFTNVVAYAEENPNSAYAFQMDNGRTIQVQSDGDDVAAMMRSISGSDLLTETGADIRVAVYDLGMVEGHPLFAHNLNASSQVQAQGALDHATRLGGIIHAFAPDSAINSHWNREVNPYVPTLPNPMTDGSSDIAVHSWGDVTCSRVGMYNRESAAYDTYTIPTIFAAGNSGSRCETENGYGTILMGPQSAKNIITVGSTDGNGVISDFSSTGPTEDGRLAPTVVLPGESVLSTCAQGTFCEASGTSYTAPGVGGIVAQLFEQYRNMFGETESFAPATVRALLANSTVDLGNPGPDYAYGFGQVNAVEASRQLGAYSIIENSVADNQTSQSLVIVPESTNELRVTLAWNDVPAVFDPETYTLVGPILVNDLDVVLISPEGDEYRPFVLDPANPAQVATTGVDSLNTIEQVVVANPMAGEWIISVTAAIGDEAGEAQPFSVVYTAKTDGIVEPPPTNVGEGVEIPLSVSLSEVDATISTTNAHLLTFVVTTLATLAVAKLRVAKDD